MPVRPSPSSKLLLAALFVLLTLSIVPVVAFAEAAVPSAAIQTASVLGVTGLDPEDEAKIAAQSGDVGADLAAGTIPTGGAGVEGAWGLLNLIVIAFCALSALLQVVHIIRRILSERRAKDDPYQESNRNSTKAILTSCVAIATSIAIIAYGFSITDFSQPVVWMTSPTIFLLLGVLIHAAFVVVRMPLLRAGEK
jgi:hypothetical protein